MSYWKTDHLAQITQKLTTDPNDQRWGHQLQDSIAEWVLCGYPDDEGIKNNGGRLGSSEGPQGFRNVFYKMTPHLLRHQSKMFDLGDIAIGGSLDDRHANLQKELLALHQKDKRIISVGGGHDFGFPDGAAFCEYFLSKGERPFVINFDAHLDVRPLSGKITSGTPFFRLLEKFGSKIDFVEIGIQPQCNSKQHLQWAIDKGALIYHLEEVQKQSLHKILSDLTHQFQDRPAFISIDIDAFAGSIAPGCSQSWPTGIHAQEFLSCLSLFKRRLETRHIGIYELAPTLDVSLQTQRLAAQIVFEFLTWDDHEKLS